MATGKIGLERPAGRILEKTLYSQGGFAGFMQWEAFTTVNFLPNYLLYRHERARAERIKEKREEPTSKTEDAPIIGENSEQSIKSKKYKLGGYVGMTLDVLTLSYAIAYYTGNSSLMSQASVAYWHTKVVANATALGLLAILFTEDKIKKSKIGRRDNQDI